MTTTFAPDKVLRRRSGRSPLLGTDAGGYEIRHGRVAAPRRRAAARSRRRRGRRLRRRRVLGTSWHGAARARRASAARCWRASPPRAGARFVPGHDAASPPRASARLDALGDLIATTSTPTRLAALIEGGAPPDLPTIETEVRPCCAS